MTKKHDFRSTLAALLLIAAAPPAMAEDAPPRCESEKQEAEERSGSTGLFAMLAHAPGEGRDLAFIAAAGRA